MMTPQQATKYAMDRYTSSTIGSVRAQVAEAIIHSLEVGHGPGVIIAELKRWYGLVTAERASQLREEIDSVLKDIREESHGL